MAKVKLDIGSVVDFLTKGELDETLAKYKKEADAQEQEYLKGIKYFRLPVLIATATNGTLLMGSETGQGRIAPEMGYTWSITRLFLNGLGTSDAAVVYRNAHSIKQNAMWQLTGSVPAATFSKLSLVLNGGDKLEVAGVGSLTSTVQCFLTGEAIEIPSEMIGKLI